MVEHTYDLVVVGDHLGGLAAAALSAKRGARVLVFENTEEAAEDRPMEYLNAICGGPEKEAGLGRFFHELGLSPFGPLGDDRIHFTPLHPPLQVVLPGHRVNIFQDKVARNWEVEREYGDVQRFLNDIQRREEAFRERLFRIRSHRSARGRSFPRRTPGDLRRFFRLRALRREAERETFSSFLASLALPPGLADVLVGQAQGVARFLPSTLPWAVGLRSARVLEGGLFQNASGQSGILNGLKEVFRRAGGECRPLVTLEHMELPRSEGARLSLSAGGVVQAGRVIFDLPVERSLSYFNAETVKSLRRRKIDQVEEEWSFGILRLKIKRGWEPECMGRYLVIDPFAGGWKRLSMTLLLAGEPGDRTRDRSAHGMEVMGLFGPDGDADRQRQAIWDRLMTLMPFLDKSIEGGPLFRGGSLRRFALRDRNWRSLEEYYRTGRRPTFFRLRQATFLRNEEYVGVGMAEGLMSGAGAIE